MMKTFLLLLAALLCAVQGFVVQPGKMNKVSIAPKTSLKTPSSIIAAPQKKQEDSSTSLHYGLARYGGYGGYGRGYGGYGLSRYGGYGGYYDDDYYGYGGYGGYGRGYGGYGGYGRGYGRMGYGRGYGGYGGYWDDYDDWGYGGYYGYMDPT